MKSNSPERSEAEANKMHCEDTKTQIHTLTVTIIISVLIKATEGNHTSLLLFIFMDLSFVLWLKEIHNFSLLKWSSAHTRMKKINDVLFLFFNSLNHNFCINLQYFWSEGGEYIHIYYRASGCWIKKENWLVLKHHLFLTSCCNGDYCSEVKNVFAPCLISSFFK